MQEASASAQGEFHATCIYIFQIVEELVLLDIWPDWSLNPLVSFRMFSRRCIRSQQISVGIKWFCHWVKRPDRVWRQLDATQWGYTIISVDCIRVCTHGQYRLAVLWPGRRGFQARSKDHVSICLYTAPLNFMNGDLRLILLPSLLLVHLLVSLPFFFQFFGKIFFQCFFLMVELLIVSVWCPVISSAAVLPCQRTTKLDTSSLITCHTILSTVYSCTLCSDVRLVIVSGYCFEFFG